MYGAGDLHVVHVLEPLEPPLVLGGDSIVELESAAEEEILRHRQPAVSQMLHELRLVDDADELSTLYHLLPQEGSTSALDQIEVGIDLVGDALLLKPKPDPPIQMYPAMIFFFFQWIRRD